MTMEQNTASVLVVDDEELVQDLLVRILNRGGYGNVKVASSSERASKLLQSEDFDLILTDMHMPGTSGIGLLSYVHQSYPDIATLMISGANDESLAEKALSLGAYGYIIKPFRPNEVLIGVKNALRRRALELENRAYRQQLEDKVELRTADLSEALSKLRMAEKGVRAARTETIKRLAIAGEFRDEDTGRHVLQMSRYCEVLARAVGVDAGFRESIREAGSLHDLGKIAIPDHILLKPGPLSASERSVMQTHAEIGHRMLSGSESPLLELAAQIALTHHEKLDGTGYPNGLAGESIPLSGRIAAIADVFDALTTDRVYRPAFSLTQATDMMNNDSGSQFDPDLLALFWDLLPGVALATRNDHQGDSIDFDLSIPALT
jgi:putative two-component system response regulator